MALENTEHDRMTANMSGQLGHVIPGRRMSITDRAIYQNMSMQLTNQMSTQGKETI